MKTTSVATMVMTMTFQMTRLMTLLTICSHTNSLCLIISLGCNVVSTRDSTDWDASGGWPGALLCCVYLYIWAVKYRWSPQKSKKQWQRPSNWAINRGWPEIIGNHFMYPWLPSLWHVSGFYMRQRGYWTSNLSSGRGEGGWHSEMSKSLHRENLSNHILLLRKTH